MYTHDDIIITGDSFCRSRYHLDNWPYLLASKLIGEEKILPPRGAGYAGCSWWSVRNNLLNELKEKPAKVLVICHTEPHRIWSDSNIALNTTSVMNKTFLMQINEKDVKEINSADKVSEAGKMYYEHLYSRNFHNWANKAWFKELDEIIEQNNIEKTIHLHCFPHSKEPWNDYTFRNGIDVTNVLFSLVDESIQHDPKLKNHFTADINIKLAEELYKVAISDLKTGTVTLAI